MKRDLGKILAATAITIVGVTGCGGNSYQQDRTGIIPSSLGNEDWCVGADSDYVVKICGQSHHREFGSRYTHGNIPDITVDLRDCDRNCRSYSGYGNDSREERVEELNRKYFY